ncbi:MAG: hypothetical protein HC845_05800 [Akkermansiaceae bacterium]|nr:hypothetical protein [Akkermansiaceae bacterium]
MPSSTAPNILETAFNDLTTSNLPAEIGAYASFYRGNLYKKLKRNTEALEAYLSVSTLFPAGSMVLNAAAELQAAGYLIDLKRQEEAKSLLASAVAQSQGTVIADEANKRLENIK